MDPVLYFINPDKPRGTDAPIVIVVGLFLTYKLSILVIFRVHGVYPWIST